ncbi:hypothetical protein B0T22DRAFT_181412 [Podospora appendiculata]|uniref:Uncharacterized protein n=1 Tax=Podospora appendiculata TaxID=314037 RepID=A0AAE1CDM1_9PEZI|nr:hypothetical protein B0T22DRAFT_181412 [Podospora appendiculata]
MLCVSFFLARLFLSNTPARPLRPCSSTQVWRVFFYFLSFLCVFSGRIRGISIAILLHSCFSGLFFPSLLLWRAMGGGNETGQPHAQEILGCFIYFSAVRVKRFVVVVAAGVDDVRFKYPRKYADLCFMFACCGREWMSSGEEKRRGIVSRRSDTCGDVLRWRHRMRYGSSTRLRCAVKSVLCAVPQLRLCQTVDQVTTGYCLPTLRIVHRVSLYK